MSDDKTIMVPASQRSTEFALGRLMPQSVTELYFFAEKIAASGMFPNANTADKAFLMMSQGIELNLSPLQSVRELNIINGRVDVPASVRAANIQSSPKLEMWEVESDDAHCTLKAKRRDRTNSYEVTIRAEDMSQGDRNKHREHMADWLFARVVRRASRQYFADMNLGMDTDDTPEPDRIVNVRAIEREVGDDQSTAACENCGKSAYLKANTKGGVFLACPSCGHAGAPPQAVRDAVRGNIGEYIDVEANISSEANTDSFPASTTDADGRDATPEEVAQMDPTSSSPDSQEATSTEKAEPSEPSSSATELPLTDERAEARKAWIKEIVAALKDAAVDDKMSPEHQIALKSYGWDGVKVSTWLPKLADDGLEALRHDVAPVVAL